MKRNILKAVGALVVTTLIAACGGGGGGGGGGGSAPSLTAAEKFVQNLRNAGELSYDLAKDPTASGAGWIVVEVEYGEYYAININDADRYDYSYDIDYFWDYAVPVWAVGNGYYEDDYGYLYEKTQGNSKDLLTATANMEEVRVGLMGQQLSADYGLSQERGVEVARLAAEWQTLKKSRALTNADADRFSTQVLGFKLTDAFSAYEKNDQAQITDLVEKAAEANSTSPEHIRELMVKFN